MVSLALFVLGVILLGSMAVAYAVPRGQAALPDVRGVRWQADHIPRAAWGLSMALFLGSGLICLPILVFAMGGYVGGHMPLGEALSMAGLSCAPLLAFVPIARRQQHTEVVADTHGLALSAQWPWRPVRLSWAEVEEVRNERDVLVVRTADRSHAVRSTTHTPDEVAQIAEWLALTHRNTMAAPTESELQPPPPLRHLLRRVNE